MSRWDKVTDRWPGRNEVIASLIEPHSSVIDLGAGARGLKSALPRGCRYRAVDLPRFDMNRGLWPKGSYDVAVMSGVLEYAADPAEVFVRLRGLSSRVLVSYAHGGLRDPDWNDLSHVRFSDLAKAAGWKSARVGEWRARGIRTQDIWELS